ncbi:MAG: GH3 auxin-responsive promoter family protein [Verrucomicrobia bacterium]|nr:GH3 auxin-responsive promoter family protein [Verrucomicrobiota bacterium]
MNPLSLLFHKARTSWIKHRLWNPFVQSLRNPRAAQERVRAEILRFNRNTTFGRKHQFHRIYSHADYVKNVPVQSYEDLRPYIEGQDRDRCFHLTAGHPIHYAQTSGTTGKPKYIPILPDTISRFRQAQSISAYCNQAAIPGLYEGRILAIISPAVEGYLPTGTPFGSMSGLIYQTMPGWIRSRYLIPMAVFEIENHEIKYYVIAAFALAEPSISLIASANPSTFLKIASVIEEQWESLLDDIESGTLGPLQSLGTEQRDRIGVHFRGNPNRAAELRELFIRREPIPSAGIWPHLKAVATWLDGNCGVFVPALRKRLHPRVRLVEMGYLASEFRGSVTVDPIRNLAVPTLDENYFEFVERDCWDQGRPEFLTLDQIRLDVHYYIIVTTRSGLYRYFINDIVRFQGYYLQTPTIHFVEKGTGATSITGEKLHENQVIRSMNALFADLGIDYSFFLMVADEEAGHYILYLENSEIGKHRILSNLEGRLAALNLEYKSKRGSGRLGPTEIKLLKPGTGETLKNICLQAGQREAQFKFPCLVSKSKLKFNINDYVED